MRVVVDTNVFVGACIGRGAASKVIEACIAGEAEPIMSRALYLEYEDVLDRADLFRRARLDFGERQTLFDIFVGKCTLTDVYFTWRPNLRDEGDNHLIELAIAGNAGIVITNNLRDFDGADLRFDHIRIVSPRDFLEEFGQ
jgi:putative PIN family toxin of toxin-antitoxin system